MTIAPASRVTCATLEAGRLIGIVLASIALVTGICPVAVARSREVPSADALIPVQLSMGTTGSSSTPAARKRLSDPAKPEGGLTPGERRQLTEAIKRLTPEERKRLAKAMKRLTPEERRQLAEGVKRQLAGKGPASQMIKRAR